jgi:hypothetical protein
MFHDGASPQPTGPGPALLIDRGRGRQARTMEIAPNPAPSPRESVSEWRGRDTEPASEALELRLFEGYGL